MGMTSRCSCGTGEVPDIYTKPFTGHWFPGNVGDGSELTTAIPFPHLENFVTSLLSRANPVPNGPFHAEPRAGHPDRIFRWSGSPPCDRPSRAEIILDALPVRIPPVARSGRVIGRGSPREPSQPGRDGPLRWKIVAGVEVIAEGEARDRTIALAGGSARRLLPAASDRRRRGFTEQAPLIVAPPRAFGGDFDRCWLLAVQLYGVRSARNWGHRRFHRPRSD